MAQDGSGDFTRLQDAINACKSFPYQRIVIHLKNGIYKEKVHVYAWNTQISIQGESKEQTIITFDDNFNEVNLGRNSTFHTSTVLVEGNDFIAKNLTIQNTSGSVGQAISLTVNADRCYFENCNILGFQDTLYLTGEGFIQYFKNCFIEGSTDFIFGEATVLFENCIINSKADSYITAASTPQHQPYGFVFKNCKLTADSAVSKVFLGRLWRQYAKTVFIQCEMGNHIVAEGWHNWNNPEAEQTTYYAEYQCSGLGYQPQKRVKWSHQLTKSQTKKFQLKTLLKTNTINWIPK